MRHELTEATKGGKRCRGLYKRDVASAPLITVVTIAFNGGTELEETICSALSQTYKNIEFLVIDGGSTDSTLKILQKYDSQIDYWVSEPDGGIYDAMNKGISLSTGDWIIFINCGDCLYSPNALEELFESDDHRNATVLFGKWQVRYPSGRTKLRNPGKTKDLWKGSQFCHQATLIRGDYHRLHHYDISNPIVADFGFFYKAHLSGVTFEEVPNVIASITSGGVSDIERLEVVRSFGEIVEKNTKSRWYFRLLFVRHALAMLVKKIMR